MMEAVAEGVARAFDVPSDTLLHAVRQGVADAIWRVATNATDMPCADFYETIKEGVSEAMSRHAGDP